MAGPPPLETDKARRIYIMCKPCDMPVIEYYPGGLTSVNRALNRHLGRTGHGANELYVFPEPIGYSLPIEDHLGVVTVDLVPQEEAPAVDA